MPTVNEAPTNYPNPSDQNSHAVETEEVSFIRSQNYCVCFVDIVESTRITSSINNPEKVRKYYGIFLNTMAAIAKNFGGKVVKNVGDCLILYYPKTSDSSNKSSFKDVIECCITMIEARDTINEKLHEEELPSLSYRISADYGRVEVAITGPSQSNDLFGPTMNMCAKINSKASPNGLVIGDGLHKVAQSYSLLTSHEENYYHFEELLSSEAQQGEFNKYPIFFLQHNDRSTFSQPETKQDERHTPSILLVDDEEDILYTFKTGLSSEGFNVEAFADPMEALIHFATVNPSHYDLAILDIRMPGLNGLQLYYRLKAINRNIKILFVSALDAVPELISILPDVKTTEDIIKKPITIGNFVSAVNTALA
jgi:two-component system, OmpR family, response regulator ChvI